MRQVIYTSIARKGLELGGCTAILKGAVANNTSSHITGVLLLKDDVFVQYLEGPDAEIERTLGIIRRDRRHTHVTVLADLVAPLEARLFDNWRMGFYHLGATEAALGPALVANSPIETLGHLAEKAPDDLCARLLDAFWLANKNGIVRHRSPALAA